jgi:hypothetical protein
MVVLGLAPLVWLARVLPSPTGFLFWRDAIYSDLILSHWPNAVFLADALRTWREVPAWNPLILSGTPFAADPLAGIWYPAAWLCGFLPGALGFNLALACHLALAGAGAYAILRQQGATRMAAVGGGLIFQGAAPLVAHAAAGHVTLVYAAAWTPWLVVFLRRALESDEPKLRALRSWLAVGAVAGLILLADPRWAPACALLAGCLAAEAWMRRRRRLWRMLGGSLAASGVALGIGAVLLLPLAQFARLSTRANLDAAQRSFLSLPAPRLLGFLLPEAAGSPEWAAYAGIATLVLGLLALTLRAPHAGFWSAVFVGSLVLALGDALPFHGLLVTILPGAAWVRVPARYIILSALALGMLAGAGIEALARAASAPLQRLRWGRLGVAGCGAVVAGLAVSLGPSLGWPAAAASAGFAVASTVVVLAGLSGRPWARWATAGLLVLLVLDLGLADARLVRVRGAQQVLGERADLAAWLVARLEPGERVFSPSYSLPQQTAAQWGIEMADGVSPLQLTAYQSAMARATGFSTAEYSVTLPPFPDGDVTIDWGPRIDSEALGRLGVRYVVSEYPLRTGDLGEPQVVGGVYVYRNERARPRAWVEPPPAGGAHWVAVDAWEWSPNHIRVRAGGPGELVLSEIAYPGWMVRVDGVEAPIDMSHEILRAVHLPAGDHVVDFVYTDRLSNLGAAFSALAWLVVLVGWKLW